MRKLKTLSLLLAAFAIAASAGVAQALKPTRMMAHPDNAFKIEQHIPKSFGKWASLPGVHLIEPVQDSLSKILYSQEVVRGYTDPQGHMVMMLIAYGEDQSEQLQMHRPEVCYAADGFRVSPTTDMKLSYADDMPALSVRTLITQREDRIEPITYWMRVGYDISEKLLERQRLKIEYGLRGYIPDGALIRVSTINIPAQQSFEIQKEFIQDLIRSVDPETRTFLIGQPEKAFLKD